MKENDLKNILKEVLKSATPDTVEYFDNLTDEIFEMSIIIEKFLKENNEKKDSNLRD
jgi:hypothetical protein